MEDFIKKSALKEYISGQKIRISQAALNDLIKYLARHTQSAIKRAKQKTEEDKRSTILPPDIAAVIEKEDLNWQELAQEVIKQGPIELGQISQAIDKWIEDENT